MYWPKVTTDKRCGKGGAILLEGLKQKVYGKDSHPPFEVSFSLQPLLPNPTSLAL
jgi:hypothetical protein